MTMPTKTQTIVDDPIVDLQQRVIQAARERAVFLGLSARDAAAELKAAQKVAAAIGAQLRVEHKARQR
jgi:hypothetical protein